MKFRNFLNSKFLYVEIFKTNKLVMAASKGGMPVMALLQQFFLIFSFALLGYLYKFYSRVLFPCRRSLEHAAGEEESIMLEGDIGGALVLQRKIYIPNDHPEYFQIDSSIIARKVGAGSGGFSRFGPTTPLSLSQTLFSFLPIKKDGSFSITIPIAIVNMHMLSCLEVFTYFRQ
jgi:hypothetical protein